MLPVVINHITAPRLHYRALFDLAADIGAVGVELRNDLDRPLFDGDAPIAVADAARAHGLRIVGLSQVYPFNRWSDATAAAVATLVEQAVAAGAETISLIPANDGTSLADGERQDAVRAALEGVLPLIEGTALVALVEPLGFATSSLRSKTATVAIVEALDAADRIGLVHDTFHHTLAGGGRLFPRHTGIVHVSGVVDPALALDAMRDGDRVLVDARDRLGNVAQLAALVAGGYRGPVSVEAFSPEVHALPHPAAALKEMTTFIEDELKTLA